MALQIGNLFCEKLSLWPELTVDGMRLSMEFNCHFSSCEAPTPLLIGQNWPAFEKL